MRKKPPSKLIWPGSQATSRSDLFDAWAIGFSAGATSGTFAALVTTPFDVVKTSMQLQQNSTARSSKAGVSGALSSTATPLNSFQTFLAIAKKDGATGLLAGVGPRVGKVAPACAIMISVFELGKAVFANQWPGRFPSY